MKKQYGIAIMKSSILPEGDIPVLMDNRRFNSEKEAEGELQLMFQHPGHRKIEYTIIPIYTRP